MDNGHKVSRFLVVTPNVVVGEDLREALLEYSDAEVDVHTSISAQWDNDYRLAFFGISIDSLLSEPRIEDMRKSGTKIVVLNGFTPKSAFEHFGIMQLEQPFMSDDVDKLLLGAGIERARKF